IILATEPVADSIPVVETEPIAEAEPESEPVLEAEPVDESEPVVDAFAQASGALGFMPVIDDEPADSVPDADEPVLVGATPAPVHVAPRRHRVAKRLVAAGA